MEKQDDRRAALDAFVEAARLHGASDTFLADLLERRGWPRKEIHRAFGSLYERLTGLSIPARGSGLFETPRDAFLYLLSFGTLAVWTWGLGSLLFTLINGHFADPLAIRRLDDPSVEFSGSMASLIVGYPAYLLVMRLIIRGVQERPDRLDSAVRRWLTYLALLVAAATVIGDLITFLSYFLRGELTARFVLEVFTVLAIAGAVFWYYLLSLEKPAARRIDRSALFAAPTTLAVGIAIVLGFWSLGGRGRQRDLRADWERTEELRRTALAVEQWYARRKTLPPDLKALRRYDPQLRLEDPVVKTSYEFIPGAATEYQLCATFALEAKSEQLPYAMFNAHPAGRQCFHLDAATP